MSDDNSAAKPGHVRLRKVDDVAPARPGARDKWPLRIALAVLGIIVLGLIPLPSVPNARDKERMVAHALNALLGDRRVLTSKGFCRLLEGQSVTGKSRIYFRNDLGVPDNLFLEHGLQPVPRDRVLDLDKDDGLVAFSLRDSEDRPAANVQFYYVFGGLGAHGYEIKLYRSLWVRYFVYLHAWVS